MSEETGFLKAIADNLKDETARLAFADWLEDRDDPRAPWVRDPLIWHWMKPKAKNPTAKLLAAIQRGHGTARDVLVKLGPTVVPAILAALHATDEVQPWPLWNVLGNIGPRAEPVLSLLLESVKATNPRVRTGAFWCLSYQAANHDSALQAVVDGLDDEYWQIRSYALLALSQIGPRGAVAIPKLIQFLKRKEPNLVGGAIATLRCVGGLSESLIPDVIPSLTVELDALPASAALSQIGVAAIKPLLEAAKDFTGIAVVRAVAALIAIGPEAIPVLRQAMKDLRGTPRQIAADALDRLSPESEAFSLPVLVEGLRSSDSQVRERAITQIRFVGPTTAAGVLPVLVELLSDQKLTVQARWPIAEVIGIMGWTAEAAIPALLDAVVKEGWPLSEPIIRSLVPLGGGPSAIVVLLADSPRREVTRNDPTGLTLFMVSHEVEELAGVREVILPAYRKRKPTSTFTKPAELAITKPPAEAVPAIRKFLGAKSPATRIIAVFALRHVGTREAATALIDALKDKNQLVRSHAARALGRIGKGVEGVTAALQASANDLENAVRTAVGEAIKRLKA